MRKYGLAPVEELGQQTPTMSSLHITDSMPKSIRNKVRTLLSHIQRNGNYIQWDHNGQVSVDGNLIPNSQIIDLIKCCFFPYKDFIPEGFDQFKTALSDINTPRTLIGGGALSSFNKGLPPPGLPTRKRGASPPNKKQWHQM